MAGIYNLSWGLFSALDPQWLFRFAGMPEQNYPEIFACLGMVVGIYGILYLEVARARARLVDRRGWPARQSAGPDWTGAAHPDGSMATGNSGALRHQRLHLVDSVWGVSVRRLAEGNGCAQNNLRNDLGIARGAEEIIRRCLRSKARVWPR